MGYRIYKNNVLFSEYGLSSHDYVLAKDEFEKLRSRHKKDGVRITLCGVFGDILEDYNRLNVTRREQEESHGDGQ